MSLAGALIGNPLADPIIGEYAKRVGLVMIGVTVVVLGVVMVVTGSNAGQAAISTGKGVAKGVAKVAEVGAVVA